METTANLDVEKKERFSKRRKTKTGVERNIRQNDFNKNKMKNKSENRDSLDSRSQIIFHSEINKKKGRGKHKRNWECVEFEQCRTYERKKDKILLFDFICF